MEEYEDDDDVKHDDEFLVLIHNFNSEIKHFLPDPLDSLICVYCSLEL